MLFRSTASPLHTNEFYSKLVRKSSLFIKLNKVSLGTLLTVGYVVLYCNRFIILFTQIIHKKKKTFLILQYNVKNNITTQQLTHRGWHQVNRQEELLMGGGRGGGRW